ncbi:MAG: glycosyltransferase family 2 protein [Crocinitomicaceae bacterium]|nr:glycosyltransferase family 2 protein [Crocinitomicaceae bacterium]
MIQLSIVIVNYNVEFFLEQCLNSVRLASKNVSTEVFVVDNNSIDGSLEMIRAKFPEVHLIANKDNVGFSRANNQALKIANGKYHLLLNPDTVVEEDTFEKCVKFMDEHEDCGGLGVNMIDGKGNFLPESKRGLPTPRVAFYKIFGLARLFPKSKRFGKYHLSYLDRNETHKIEVLSGAFMMMRKSALDKVGLLDEDFFMYGEDIDLSYRIIKGGYNNYYFPDTRIIHYKGESTKKSSVNYVFVFYNAMIIFARKHFGGKDARLFSFLINLAIYFRASLAIAWRMIKRLFLPLLDLIIILAGLLGISHLYQNYSEIYFPAEIQNYGLAAYAGIWVLIQVFSGGYDKPAKLIKHFTGALIGTGVILMFYALLSKEYQFSRLIILFGGGFVFLYYLVSRILLHTTIGGRYRIGGEKNKRFAIVGSRDEVERVNALLVQTNSNIQEVYFLAAENQEKDDFYSGNFTQLNQIIDIHKVDEIIFCAKDISAQEIIRTMMNFTDFNLDFKIAQPETAYLIGSNSIDTKGDLYVMEINRIDKPSNRRNKRILDFVLSLFLIITIPLTIWFFKHKKQFLKNIFSIFGGKSTFVGYGIVDHASNLALPKLKKGVLPITLQVPDQNLTEDAVGRLNLIYAKNHSVYLDFKLIINNLGRLDR